MSDDPTDRPDSSLVEDFLEAGMSEGAAAIMAAALQLFAHQGYAATTVRQIVSEADVTNPMLYYYFDSKEDVFRALIEVMFASMAETVERIYEEHDTCWTRLREITRAYFDGCRDSPEGVRFIYSALFSPAESHPAFEVPASHNTAQRLIAQTLEEAIETGEFEPHPDLDAPRLTERFLGMIDNHLLGALNLHARGDSHFQHRRTMDDYLGDDAIEEMLEFFFHGAGRLNHKEDA